MNFERTREFVVAGPVVPQEQQLGLASAHAGQDCSYAALFLRRGEELVRSSRPEHGDQTFVSASTGAPPQFVKSESDGGSLQPTTRPFSLCLRIPGQLQKYFDGEFLRAAVVMNDAGNGTGCGLIVSLKEGLKIGCGGIEARRS